MEFEADHTDGLNPVSERVHRYSDRDIQTVRLPAILDGAFELAFDRPLSQSPAKAGLEGMDAAGPPRSPI